MRYGNQSPLTRVKGAAARHHVEKPEQAHGTASEGRDVDFVAPVRAGHRLLDRPGFGAAVEASLGCPADVVSERGLPPAIDQEMRRQCIPL